MSYCRWSEGDVYLYQHCQGGWQCCMCCLTEEIEVEPFDCNIYPEGEDKPVHVYVPASLEHPSVTLWTIGQVRDHLQAHIDAGHTVPPRAMALVLEEIAEFGEDWDGRDICPECGGDGVCINCEGWGSENDEPGETPAPCEDCLSTGRCSYCGGTGRV